MRFPDDIKLVAGSPRRSRSTFKAAPISRFKARAGKKRPSRLPPASFQTLADERRRVPLAKPANRPRQYLAPPVQPV